MSRIFRIAAGIAGLYGCVVGMWGLIGHSGGTFDEGSVESGFLWVSIGILSVAVAVVLTNVAAVAERRRAA